MHNINRTQYQEQNVEDFPTINKLVDFVLLQNQKQLLIKNQQLNINFELSDSEEEELILNEESLKNISTVGIGFREPFKDQKNKEGINFVVANLHLIVKKESKTEKEIISVPIKLEQDKNTHPIIYSMAYHFDTSTAGQKEIQSIKNRTEIAKKVIDEQELKAEKIDKIYDRMFDQHFRHSEQALFEYLKMDSFILSLLNLMYKEKVIKLQSVVLDIYSTKNMCKNCQYCAYGVMSDDTNENNDEFSAILERKIIEDNKNRIKPIQIDNQDKQRSTFYRVIRLVSNEYHPEGNEGYNPLKNQKLVGIDISLINKRIITNEFSINILEQQYKNLIKNFTIFCSRGVKLDENFLLKQLTKAREDVQQHSSKESSQVEQ